MKTKIGIIFLALFTQLCFSQVGVSKMIKGQVKNDLIPIEDVIVFNTKDNSGTTVNQYGSFEIKAAVNDTLVFSSLVFKSKKVILTQEDFLIPHIIVPLEIYTSELAEVIIQTKKGINPIEDNTRKYVDMNFFDDAISSPKNTVMPSDGSIDKGTNFVRIYKDVISSLQKDHPRKRNFHKDTAFSDYVLTHVNYWFFVNTLNLKDSEIKLFLIFCENDFKSRLYMTPDQEFQLLDFLTNKNKEFKAIAMK